MAGRHHRYGGSEIFQYRAPEPTIRSHRASRRGRRRVALGLILLLAIALAGAATVVAYGRDRLTTDRPTGVAAARSCLQSTHTVTGAGFVAATGRYTALHGPDASLDTVAMGVDAGGRVVGGYAGQDGRTHGFVWQDRSYRTVDAPDASGTTLIRISDQGQLLGVYDDDRHACHSFLLRNGRYVSGSTPDPYRAANDILDLWLARA